MNNDDKKDKKLLQALKINRTDYCKQSYIDKKVEEVNHKDEEV